MKKNRIINFFKSNLVFGLGVVVFVAVLAFYFIFFGISKHYSLSENDTNWANFGSYVGGCAGSFFSFITLIYVVKNFSLEKDEKEEAKQDLEQQRKDRENDKRKSDFLSSLNLLNLCITNLSLRYNGKTVSGPYVIHLYIQYIYHKINNPSFGDGSKHEYTEYQFAISPFIKFSELIINEYINSYNSYTPMINKNMFSAFLSNEACVLLILCNTVSPDFFNNYFTVEDIKNYTDIKNSFDDYKKQLVVA